MDRNVGASFTLSVLTVIVFAVVLYQPDSPPCAPAVTRAPGPATTASGALSQPGSTPAAVDVIEARNPDAPAPVPVPVPVPAQPAKTGNDVGPMRAENRPLPVVPAALRVIPASTRPGSGRVSQPRTAARREPTPLPEARATPARPLPTGVSTAPSEPRGAFTKVRPGETLASIAVRVYGSEDAAERLWMANRDLLDHQDAPLPDGAMLRTP